MEPTLKARVLIVDDDLGVLQAARLYLKQHVESVDIMDRPQDMLQSLQSIHYDVILLDMNFTRDLTSGEEGFFYLRKIKAVAPRTEVVLITAYGDVELAVKAIKEGATDFVIKPWQNEKLLATVTMAVQLSMTRNQVRSLQSQKENLIDSINKPFYNLLGTSDPMQEVFDMIKKVSKTDANILILGENGTGKELVSRAIHRDSQRSRQPFISVDMGAIPETLFESELFGHKRGAFTDAKTDRAGHFEVACGGTLFLDEIGNLPYTLQARILRVLETREVKRVGSNQAVPVDIRLICATNSDIHQLVRDNKFREDLLYRINTIEIKLPPLRERGTDILLLAETFLQEYCRKYQKPLRKLAADTRRRLLEYHWPGNIRELRHAIERAVIMGETHSLTPDDFFLSARTTPDRREVSSLNLEEMEAQSIVRALEKHAHVISRAAGELGLSRAALYRRMEKYGITP
ncbi:MAG: sigma-54-dependent Fis family transcriptional regulator [Candidatus Aminicenantes bacterium]|nr:sigma-54-dependent Fis family transcriptional regulator [Candidatus Aminicenantes bacterium]